MDENLNTSGKTHATSGFNWLKIALTVSQYPGTEKIYTSALATAQTQLAFPEEN
jgi:hypothetical protein